jgi:hypothetical protein
MTIVFLKLALCLAAVSQGAHAVDNVNEVNVKLPSSRGPTERGHQHSLAWHRHTQVTTSYTTADETEMLASLDTPINRATRGTTAKTGRYVGPTAKTGESGWTGRIGRHPEILPGLPVRAGCYRA